MVNQTTDCRASLVELVGALQGFRKMFDFSAENPGDVRVDVDLHGRAGEPIPYFVFLRL